ncbi:MAG TPA: hypothetical protein VNL35_00230 [Chloroflexota bacterium]|nr:hypothetical protein [Chloroflexota bacterium]
MVDRSDKYRRQFFNRVNLDDAALRDDTAAWKAEVAERYLLDETPLDGLDPDEIWTDDGDSAIAILL